MEGLNSAYGRLKDQVSQYVTVSFCPFGIQRTQLNPYPTLIIFLYQQTPVLIQGFNMLKRIGFPGSFVSRGGHISVLTNEL